MEIPYNLFRLGCESLPHRSQHRRRDAQTIVRPAAKAGASSDGDYRARFETRSADLQGQHTSQGPADQDGLAGVMSLQPLQQPVRFPDREVRRPQVDPVLKNGLLSPPDTAIRRPAM